MTTATHDSRRAAVAGALREFARSFTDRRLLTWASALSFQIVTAVVPFLLFSLGLIGFLNLESLWNDVAESIEPHVSDAAFTVIEDTAKTVVTEKQLWWVTIGFAIAIWEFSGGIRAIMGGLAEIYDLDDGRSWSPRWCCLRSRPCGWGPSSTATWGSRSALCCSSCAGVWRRCSSGWRPA